jgi:nitrogen regulatory protein PII-like uncharacterized protein
VDHLPAKQELSAIFFRVNLKHHNMKPLLYIGAALMMGAGIYGFVDYKKKNRSKEFQSLYREEQKKDVQAPVTETVVPAVVPAPVVTEEKETVVLNKETVDSRKQDIKKIHKKLSSKQFSRAVVEEYVDEVSLPKPEKKAGQ